MVACVAALPPAVVDAVVRAEPAALLIDGELLRERSLAIESLAGIANVLELVEKPCAACCHGGGVVEAIAGLAVSTLRPCQVVRRDAPNLVWNAVSARSTPGVVIDALMATVAGLPFIDPNIDDDDISTPHFADTVHLTARERSIADAIGRGLSNKAIARELNLAMSTVANCVSVIIRKLGYESRTQIGIRYAPHGGRVTAHDVQPADE